MKQRKKLLAVLVAIAALSCGFVAIAGADSLGVYYQGGVNLNGPSYGWWYGCSPTSAGMMMGYYDIHGYKGLVYGNLVPGGAENQTVYKDGAWNANIKPVIASQGYVNDYYRDNNKVPDLNSAGFNANGVQHDDVAVPTHNANCLADFMGSGQDLVGNANGWTQFWYWQSGAKYTAADAFAQNKWNTDGMYGMDEYFRYAGYGTGQITNDASFFTQLILGKGTDPNQGCTFQDYKALIDAGLVVMIQLEGHSVFGYGYTDDDKMILDDTWGGHNQTMDWGGSYSGRDQWGITAFTPSQVPLPPSLLLMLSGLAGLVGFKLRR